MENYKLNMIENKIKKFKTSFQEEVIISLLANKNTGEIEKYGSGFLRIRREIKAYPTMKLLIANAPNGLLTTISYNQQKTDTKGGNVTNEFTDSMIKIIKLINLNNKISLNDMAIKIGREQQPKTKNEQPTTKNE